ncbi:MAG: GAF domain-containing protein [Actinobacteria bacterium]|nr:GAF domain-containing protein [Actinomycetota bacterium]
MEPERSRTEFESAEERIIRLEKEIRKIKKEMVSRTRELEKKAAQISTANALLQEEILERKRVEDELKKTKDNLAEKVAERTVEFEVTMRELQAAKEKLEAKVDERTYELSVLYDLSHILSSAISYDEVYLPVLTSLDNILEYDVAGILHETRNNKEMVMIKGKNADNSIVMETSRILLEHYNDFAGSEYSLDDFKSDFLDLSSENVEPVEREEGIRSYSNMPLIASGSLMGMMVIASCERAAFNEEQLRIFQTLTSEAAVSLRRLEVLLESEELRTKAMIDSLQDGVFLVDKDGELIVQNPTGENILELIALAEGEESSEGSAVWLVREIAEKAILDPGTQAFEEIEVHEPDLQRTYEFVASAVHGLHDELLGATVIVRDTTRKRELEKLRSRFLSSISHELRTPLTSVKEYVSIVQDGLAGDLNEEQSEYLDIAQKNTARLRLLIEDLLDATRIESNTLKLNRHEVSFSEIADACLTSVKPKAAKKGVELAYTEEQDQLPPIYADPLRITQVLTNLIDNALKFTPPGGSIRVSAGPRTTNDHFLYVSVVDTGMGIPREDTEKIFDIFYKVHTGREFSSEGTGLGLHISSEIVGAHGGKIWVESKLGQGSAFIFTIPVLIKEGALLDFVTRELERKPRGDEPFTLIIVNPRFDTAGTGLYDLLLRQLNDEGGVIAQGDQQRVFVIAGYLKAKQLEDINNKVLEEVSREYGCGDFKKDYLTESVVCRGDGSVDPVMITDMLFSKIHSSEGRGE